MIEHLVDGVITGLAIFGAWNLSFLDAHWHIGRDAANSDIPRSIPPSQVRDLESQKRSKGGDWEWNPRTTTPDEMSKILLEKCRKFDVRSCKRTSMDWMLLDKLGYSARFSCKIAPRHTRINVAPWLSTSLKFSFAKKGDDDWVEIEPMKPSDFETGFEGEKMNYVMVFPAKSIDHRATSLFCSVTQFPTGKGCTLEPRPEHSAALYGARSR